MTARINTGKRIVKGVLLAMILVIVCPIAISQTDTAVTKDTRPVKNTFESVWLINNQTLMVPVQGTFEWDFQHRFASWEDGYEDLFGLFGNANIRLGFEYVPVDRLMVGFGFTEYNLLWDFSAKYALFQQAREGGWPVGVTYYVNAAVDTRKMEKTGFEESTDRWSYFHQLMIGRKFSDDFSLQVCGNYSWFNTKEPTYDEEGTLLGRDGNGLFSATLLARYKFSNTMGLIFEYDYPVTDQEFFDPEPNLSFGLELVTSSHAFQVFVGNFQYLVPQYNHSYNPNSFGDNEPLLGFNITRLWNF